MKCYSPICDIDIYTFAFQPIDSRMYILIRDGDTGKEAIIIDPCMSTEGLQLLLDNRVTFANIVLTHEHYDHISGVNYFNDAIDCNVIANVQCANAIINPRKNLSMYFETLFYTHPEDIKEQVRKLSVEPFSCEARTVFEDSYEFEFGEHTICLYSTPGHSLGSICATIDDKCIFTGDSLLNVPVVTKLPGGSKKDYFEKTKVFFSKFSDDILVFPGHGNPGTKKTMCII